MTMPSFTMRQLLEAGVHFGHRTRRWNPKMDTFIFGVRNKVHILDLQQTVPLLQRAMQAVRDVAAAGGRILFVGTKRQASSYIRQSNERCGQFYVDHRWLGGMLTNWNTIRASITRLKELEERLSNEQETLGLTKKELLKLTRERDKLDRALGGIKDMTALPDIVVIIDTNKEDIAVAEARKLGIPIIGVIDSNSNPDGIDFPVPGNDDSLRAIELYCELLWGAVLDGLAEEVAAAGGDPGEAEKPPAENLAAAPAEETPAAQAEAPAGAGTPAGETPAETPAVAPATEAAATEAPASETPATEAAATEAPASETPATEAPASETPRNGSARNRSG